MGLRIGALIGWLDGVSCSIMVPTATFWDDLKGEPKKGAFLGPPPAAGEPKIDELLPDLRGEELNVCLNEAPIVDVMRRKKLALRQSSSSFERQIVRSRGVRGKGNIT